MAKPALHSFSTLTFDVVGTLIDFERGIIDWFRRWLRGHAVDKTDEEILAAFAVCEDYYQKRSPEKPFTAMLPLICNDMAAGWGMSADENDGMDFRSSIRQWPAFADSRAALAELKKCFRLVAVTNADSWALRYMSASLDDPFAESVTCDEVGINKPSHQVFSYMLEKLARHGVSKDDILHVAQSQYHDIRPASEMGFATAWIERRRGQMGFGATPEPALIVEPDFHSDSMAGFVDQVRRSGGLSARALKTS
jgi:putative hydrolase of the HAD superfamily